MNTIKLTPATDAWLGVELRHLAALDALETEGSFGRAAIKLGYTQSAVSQQIATLERIVGEKLVERPGGPRPVALTEAGRSSGLFEFVVLQRPNYRGHFLRPGRGSSWRWLWPPSRVGGRWRRRPASAPSEARGSPGP